MRACVCVARRLKDMVLELQEPACLQDQEQGVQVAAAAGARAAVAALTHPGQVGIAMPYQVPAGWVLLGGGAQSLWVLGCSLEGFSPVHSPGLVWGAPFGGDFGKKCGRMHLLCEPELRGALSRVEAWELFARELLGRKSGGFFLKGRVLHVVRRRKVCAQAA